MCTGRAGAVAEVARVELLRPRATRISQERSERHCLSGRVPEFADSQIVYLQHIDGDAGVLRTEIVDQHGYFCFKGVPSGIYRLWSIAEGIERYDRRGPLLEIGANCCGLCLDRR
jgi:hypothetical protein